MKKSTQKHITVKLLKTSDKKKILKAMKKRHITYRRLPLRVSANLSLETMETKAAEQHP